MKRFLIYVFIGIALMALGLLITKPPERYSAQPAEADSPLLRVFGRSTGTSVLHFINGSILLNVISDLSEIEQGQPFILEVEYLPSNQSLVKLISQSRASFHLAGASIDPDTKSLIGPGLKSSWSVIISNSGSATGFVDIDVPRRIGNFRFDLTNDKVPFSIRSRGQETSLISDYGKPAALIIGVILSLTNIVRFWWACLDRRRQSDSSTHRKSSLILPTRYRKPPQKN